MQATHTRAFTQQVTKVLWCILRIRKTPGIRLFVPLPPDGSEFVQGVLGSMGAVAADRGVYTEEALRHRFHRVHTVARRVAMIPENGGSLFK